MKTSPEIEAVINKHKEKRVRDFLSPNFDFFSKIYSCETPSFILDLYGYRERLVKSAWNFKVIWIQHFYPLSESEILESAKKYGGVFFRIAAGVEGQSYLIKVLNPIQIWVDYDSNGDVIEPLEATVDELLGELKGIP